MTVAAQRYKILANMFSRAIRNLDQIQNCSTAHACEFDQSKIEIAKDAILKEFDLSQGSSGHCLL